MKRSLSIIAILALGSLYANCSTPAIMKNHNPWRLRAMRTSTWFPKGSYRSRRVVLYLDRDASISPIGAYLDDINGSITPVMKSYVMSKPGYVLFEKIAEHLEQSNVAVFRKYTKGGAIPNVLKNATFITIALNDVEFHTWRDDKKAVTYLARAQFSYAIKTSHGVVTGYSNIFAKVPVTYDVFAVLAAKFCASIKDNI